VGDESYAGARPAVLALEPEPRSAARARQFLHRWCISHAVYADARDLVVLLGSEVVTNAVLHGRSELVLQLDRVGSRVRVAVADENARTPHQQPQVPGALDGRGLAIVDALAAAWGVEDRPLGKAVWFEVAVGS
jgi:Histidine kinase-like ATPase domain